MNKISGIIFLLSILLFIPFNENIYAESYSRLIKKGNRYYKNELYSDALRYYLEGQKKNQRACEPIFNAGTAYYKIEDYNNSIESFTKSLDLVEKEEKISDIYYNLGNSQFKSGDFQRAIESYKKGLDINPYNLNMKYNLELAIKRLEEGKKENDKSKDSESKKGAKGSGESKTDGDIESQDNLQDNLKEDTGDRSLDKREFTEEEAERLLRSVNSDQTRIINDIIKQRASLVENEKDW